MNILPFDFDSEEYLTINLDVKNAGVNAIEHYLNHGIREGRKYKTNYPVLGLVLIVKDEEPYILEWIAYHMVLGVDKFIVIDNGSSDGTKEIFINLQHEGLIDLIHFNGYKNKAPQLFAYTEVLKNLQYVDWIGFIDTDEFISVNSDLSLKRILLDIFNNESIGAIALNWAVYGSSDKFEKENGLVIDRFKHRAFQEFSPNHHFKSILKVNSVCSVGGTPHKFKLKHGKKYAYSNGGDLFDNKIHGEGLGDKIIFSPLKLNHYMIKSKLEFNLRAKKPNVAHMKFNIKDDKYFTYHDRNEKFDPINDVLILAVNTKLDKLNNMAFKNLISQNFNLLNHSKPGIIEVVRQEHSLVRVCGWAHALTGTYSEVFSAYLDDQELEIVSMRAIKRTDIFENNKTYSVFCGFELVCNLEFLDFSTLNNTSEFKLIIAQGTQAEILKSHDLKIANFNIGT